MEKARAASEITAHTVFFIISIEYTIGSGRELMAGFFICR